MYIPPADRTSGEHEWRPFVENQGFGHLVAAGTGRTVPVVVPTQFVLDGNRILLHLARPNPMFDAIAEQSRVVLSVAGDWAYIPSDWKAIGDEDPMVGIPTTYYGAVQIEGAATVEDEPGAVADVLRLQLAALQPGTPVADPELAHPTRLRSIRAITISIDAVRAKFKYGGNVDSAHRQSIIERLHARGGPGDDAAARHAERRDDRTTGPHEDSPKASAHRASMAASDPSSGV
jgi:transcriptional regulator